MWFKNNRNLTLILFGSLLTSTVILNRWVLTELKLKSFGRLWQYYVSWSDFGFFRRGLIGTILSETHLNKIISNQYIFAYIFYAILLIFSYYLVLRFILNHQKIRENGWLVFCLFLSPAIFTHFSYATGAQDLVLFIILVASIFYAKNTFSISLLLVSGVLTHELFIFLLPGIFTIKYLTRANKANVFDSTIVLSLINVIFSIIAVVFFGKLNIDKAIFDSIMTEHMPLAANQHPLWSGYSELGSTVEGNISNVEVFRSLWVNMWYILIPTVYAFFVGFISIKHLKEGFFIRLISFAAMLFPIATIFVATDYYRWVSISACLSFVSILYFISCEKLTVSTGHLKILAIFSIFLPFGAAQHNWPFPMHQFIWARYLAT
jgi:hypothetical protein